LSLLFDLINELNVREFKEISKSGSNNCDIKSTPEFLNFSRKSICSFSSFRRVDFSKSRCRYFLFFQTMIDSSLLKVDKKTSEILMLFFFKYRCQIENKPDLQNYIKNGKTKMMDYENVLTFP
jgi:hypothetical protein